MRDTFLETSGLTVLPQRKAT